MNIKYCVEIAETIIQNGSCSYRFKQKYIGEKEYLNSFKELVDRFKKKNIKARIVDFDTCEEVYKNYYSLIWN